MCIASAEPRGGRRRRDRVQQLEEITAKPRGSLIRRINSLMTRFNSLLG
jgi:hypothetical protein